MKSSRKPRVKAESGAELEYLVAWISQDMGRESDICVYGNPAGLRHLAALLVRVANHDQSGEPYPDDDSLHCHLSTGRNTKERGRLPRVTLGRVDSKDGKTPIRYGFPEIDPDSHHRMLAITDIHI